MASFALLLTVFAYCASLCAGLPAPGEKVGFVARQNAPQPPNGTIELHHNPLMSSWYLVVGLDPLNYSDAMGSKTINGTHNPLSTVTLFFDVLADPDPENNSTYYTIRSTPVAFEHHIVDNLTEVVIYNAAEQFYPEGQPIFFDISINGQSGGELSFEAGTVNATGYNADLNVPLNITGIFTSHWTYYPSD